MRKLILCACALFVCLVAIADGEKPGKNARRIDVIVAESDEASAFIAAVKYLMNDYDFDSIDKVFCLAKLSGINNQKQTVTVYITMKTVKIDDGKIALRFSGKFLSPFSRNSDDRSDVIFKGQKGSPIRDAWDIMNTLATSIPNIGVRYDVGGDGVIRNPDPLRGF